MKQITTLFILVFLSSYSSFATTKTASSGNWNAPGTWSPAGVPVCGDTIIIPAGVTVHIPANVDLNNAGNPLCAQTYIQVSGRLTFSNGRKIRLTAGGCINISFGGEIHPSGVGGGSSELIEIDHVDWWKAADGVLIGDTDGTQLGCGILLPIELAAFSYEILDEKVQISFTTASERDIDYFIIESSKDGSYWQEVGTLDAAGNSSTALTYQIDDAQPFNGVSYYRLKYVNLDGSTVAMEIISCEFYAVKYLLYPIPVNKTMFLEGQNLDRATITMVNSVGERVEIEKTLLGDKFNFNFENIKSGVYFLVIETENTKKTERVVVVRK